MNMEKFSFYKEHPKTCAPDDFWGQVKRTINGIPVSQEHIDIIVHAVIEGLQLTKEDNLLDLCCGNGALSTIIFRHCNAGVGVDFSKYLISVAQKNFSDAPRETYILSDVIDFCEEPRSSDIFSKALCYGSFAYLEHHRAERLLYLLRNNFPNIERVFIGNCPDRGLLSDFVKDRQFEPGTEDDPDSPIGIWRTKEEFSALATCCGWKISFQKMPDYFYAAHYRYDVILTHES
ncbi:class I SAM-dependent methyltransferase [Thermodesulfobacteriota bacterium]